DCRRAGYLSPRPRSGASAIEDIAAERKRQIEVEGWDSQHDDNHDNGELAKAAACYAVGDPMEWPWSLQWWKPRDRRRDLVRAGALIVAELERLDRMPQTATGRCGSGRCRR